MDIKLKFGKHNGRNLRDVYKTDPEYVQWMYDTFDKGSFLHNAAAWFIERIGDKKRREFLRTKVLMDKQFERAIKNDD